MSKERKKRKKRKNPYRGEAYHNQLMSKFLKEHAARIVYCFSHLVAKLTNTDPNNIKCGVDDIGDHIIIPIEHGECKGYFRNLLLEIMTIDRDDTPLQFDFKLNDEDYRLQKICENIIAKAEVFSTMVNSANKSETPEAVETAVRQDMQEYYDSHKSEVERIIISASEIKAAAAADLL